MRAGKPAIVSDPMPPQSVIDHAARDRRRPVAASGATSTISGDRQQWTWAGRGTRFSGLGLSGAARRQPAAQRLRRAGRVRGAARAPAGQRAGGAQRAWRWSSCPGRFQIVPGQPTLVLDVAHNPHAVGRAGAEPRPDGLLPAHPRGVRRDARQGHRRPSWRAWRRWSTPGTSPTCRRRARRSADELARAASRACRADAPDAAVSTPRRARRGAAPRPRAARTPLIESSSSARSTPWAACWSRVCRAHGRTPPDRPASAARRRRHALGSRHDRSQAVQAEARYRIPTRRRPTRPMRCSRRAPRPAAPDRRGRAAGDRHHRLPAGVRDPAAADPGRHPDRDSASATPCRRWRRRRAATSAPAVARRAGQRGRAPRQARPAPDAEVITESRSDAGARGRGAAAGRIGRAARRRAASTPTRAASSPRRAGARSREHAGRVGAAPRRRRVAGLGAAGPAASAERRDGDRARALLEGRPVAAALGRGAALRRPGRRLRRRRGGARDAPEGREARPEDLYPGGADVGRQPHPGAHRPVRARAPRPTRRSPRPRPPA